MIQFVGLFFEDEEVHKLIRLEPLRLVRSPKTFHCTFKYKPTSEEIMRFNEIIGQNGTVLIDGHGHDEENTGYRVIIPEEFREYFINYDNEGKLKIPHITMSLSPHGKAVNTCNLMFERLSEPFQVTGRFGYFLRGQREPSYEIQKVLKKEKIN